MVKERKLQQGTSNLLPSTFYRSPSHKLISPDVYPVPVDNTFVRSIESIATWKRATVLLRDFSTTHKSSFRDPISIPKNRHDPINLSFVEEDAAIDRRQSQEEALKRFCAATKKSYGTTADMLKLVIYFYL